MNLLQVLVVFSVFWASLDVSTSSQQNGTVYSHDEPDQNIEMLYRRIYNIRAEHQLQRVTSAANNLVSTSDSTQTTFPTTAIYLASTTNSVTDQKIFDLFINHTEMVRLISKTIGDTDGYIKPRVPGRFKQPHGLYHLHCRNVSQWISNNKEQYRNATNLIATINVRAKGPNDTRDQVCYFVDTIDNAQADCLRQYVEQDNAFPWAEYAARVVPENYETPTLTSENSNDTYCDLLHGTPSWKTGNITKVVLAVLIAILAAIIIAKSCQMLIAQARADWQENAQSTGTEATGQPNSVLFRNSSSNN